VIHQSPQPGDIGLTSIVGLVGWGIRVGQWLNGDGFGVYEHAFLVLDNGQLIEAQPGGAQIVGLDVYAGRHVEYVSPELTEAERLLICLRGREMVGVDYSFLDYAAIAAHHFRLPIPGLRRYIAATGHEICSALCDEVYRRAGVHLFADSRWPGYVVPADLAALLGREAQR